MRLIIFYLLLLLSPFLSWGSNDTVKHTVIYKLDIKEDISPKMWRYTQKAYDEAQSIEADIMLIHMNTYGGLVYSADSIRTKILNSNIPTWVFIDNRAASAGALISIACDSIYMRQGASIGAATVVDQSGNKMADKYQSDMRATMRATAETHGCDTIIDNGNVNIIWRRNPTVAEAMVDERVIIPGIVDSTQILTFTTNEAIANGYCEGSAESITDLLNKLEVENYEIVSFEPSWVDALIGFLTNPAVSGILIIAIIGGIYFEMQSPGLGFPIIVTLLAVIAYFAPLYIEGLAENWEIILFLVALILIAVEIFAIPGFGIAGVCGILLLIVSLVLSLVNNVNFNFDHIPLNNISKAFAIVIFALAGGFFLSIYLIKKMMSTRNSYFTKISLDKTLSTEEGFVSNLDVSDALIGAHGEAYTVLRLSGKVKIGNKIYDAVSVNEMINKGEKVIVIKHGTAQLYVERIQD